MRIEIEVDDNRIANLICTAFESGSGYWAQVKRYVSPSDKPFSVYSYPLREGGAVLIRDLEYDRAYAPEEEQFKILPGAEVAGSPGVYRLDLATVRRGLERFAAHGSSHFGDFMSDRGDAGTADVFLQFCLFGNVIYG